jgi:hypothetical protein
VEHDGELLDPPELAHTAGASVAVDLDQREPVDTGGEAANEAFK